MKRNRKGSKQRRQTIQVWTYDQARQVLPYVESIMRSLRERQLEAQEHHLSASRLAGKSGRADRATLVAREETLGAAHEAEAPPRSGARGTQMAARPGANRRKA